MSKTPGGQAASEKFLKREAQSTYFLLKTSFLLRLPLYDADCIIEHGEGAPNAPGHTEGRKPGEAPVASDSGSTDQGIAKGTNQPGELGIEGKPVGSVPDNLQGTRGT